MTISKEIEESTNIWGNTAWYVDALFPWLNEKFSTGEYSSKRNTRQHYSNYMQRIVCSLKCNIRIMQAILDAACHYEKLDNTVDEEVLSELRDEAWALYSSIDALVIQPVEGRKDRLRLFSEGGLEGLDAVGGQLIKGIFDIVAIERLRRAEVWPTR